MKEQGTGSDSDSGGVAKRNRPVAGQRAPDAAALSPTAAALAYAAEKKHKTLSLTGTNQLPFLALPSDPALPISQLAKPHTMCRAARVSSPLQQTASPPDTQVHHMLVYTRVAGKADVCVCMCVCVTQG